MMNKTIISIIVPVFNSEKYLRHCINSILKQTFCDFELLLINDGSTDNSKLICENFALNDNRIKLINKENGGVSSARNYGISKAEGEYVTFVDSDDWLPKDSLENLYNTLIKNDADISWGSIETIWPHINNRVKVDTTCYSLDNKNNIMNTLLDIHESSCSRLYKRKILLDYDIRFPVEVKNGEDSIFIHHYFSVINRMATISNVVYCYNKLENNTSVSKYFDDFGFWRRKEFDFRKKAYRKWSHSKEQYTNYVSRKFNYFIREITEYYCDKDNVNYFALEKTIREFLKDDEISKIEIDDDTKIILQNINNLELISKNYKKNKKHNQKLLEYIKKLLRNIKNIRYIK